MLIEEEGERKSGESSRDKTHNKKCHQGNGAKQDSWRGWHFQSYMSGRCLLYCDARVTTVQKRKRGTPCAPNVASCLLIVGGCGCVAMGATSGLI